MPGSFPVMKNQIDFNAGELKETSNPQDLALHGDGFFALMNQNGERVYTRDGQFYSNPDGGMVNSMGHEFVDEGGNAITFVPGQGDASIDDEGQVFQGEQLVAKIGVSEYLKCHCVTDMFSNSDKATAFLSCVRRKIRVI